MLSFIHEALGDQPQDVLAGAVDDVLVTLKNDKISSIEKKIEIEASFVITSKKPDADVRLELWEWENI